MREINQVVIISNPHSTRAKKDLVGKFKLELSKAAPHLPVVIIPTQHSRHAEELAAHYAQDKHTVLLSASGDGMYNEVINGVLSASSLLQPLLGVIPAGNANDHYRSVAQGSTIEHICKGTSRPLDVLRVEYRTGTKTTVRYAHSYIGFGLTSHIRKELDDKKVNLFTEKFVAARSFVNSKPIKVLRHSTEMEVDGITFANIQGIAKIIKLSKHSAPDDGKYEVHVIHHSTLFHKAGEVARLRSKKSTVRSRTTDYIFTTMHAISMQMDGEVFKIPKDFRVSIGIVPKAIRTVL